MKKKKAPSRKEVNNARRNAMLYLFAEVITLEFPDTALIFHSNKYTLEGDITKRNIIYQIADIDTAATLLRCDDVFIFLPIQIVYILSFACLYSVQ